MERIMRALIFAALLTLACFPTGAFAQNQSAAPPPAPTFGAACAADVQKFCPNMAPGPDRQKCVVVNMAKMSPNCQTVYNALRANILALRQACGADFQHYCPGVTTQPARGQCLSQNQPQFSAACQTAMAQNPVIAKQ
jgi:hypothetical protein